MLEDVRGSAEARDVSPVVRLVASICSLVAGSWYEATTGVLLQVLQQNGGEHILVLNEPKPKVAVNVLSGYKVEIICWPWATTQDYWQVYRELTRSVKEQLEQAGFVTPYPRQNIRIAETPGANPG